VETSHGRGRAVLAVVVAGVLLVGATAVLVDVPTAAFVLAALCAVLAAVRATDRRPPATFRARSKTFDVTALVVAALVLAVLAPAGNLT